MRGSACRGDFAILAPFPVGLTFPLDLFRHVFTPRDFRGKTLPQPRRCCLRLQTSTARGGCAIVCGYALFIGIARSGVSPTPRSLPAQAAQRAH